MEIVELMLGTRAKHVKTRIIKWSLGPFVWSANYVVPRNNLHLAVWGLERRSWMGI